MEYTAKEWYDKGYWFRNGGYWYRHEVCFDGVERGVYRGAGTYPRCERNCFPMTFESIMERGYRPVTVRELINESGFRPSEWTVPVCDGSIDLKRLWQYICQSFGGIDFHSFLMDDMQVARVCREFNNLPVHGENEMSKFEVLNDLSNNYSGGENNKARTLFRKAVELGLVKEFQGKFGKKRVADVEGEKYGVRIILKDSDELALRQFYDFMEGLVIIDLVNHKIHTYKKDELILNKDNREFKGVTACTAKFDHLFNKESV